MGFEAPGCNLPSLLVQLLAGINGILASFLSLCLHALSFAFLEECISPLYIPLKLLKGKSHVPQLVQWSCPTTYRRHCTFLTWLFTASKIGCVAALDLVFHGLHYVGQPLTKRRCHVMMSSCGTTWLGYRVLERRSGMNKAAAPHLGWFFGRWQ